MTCNLKKTQADLVWSLLQIDLQAIYIQERDTYETVYSKQTTEVFQDINTR
jgi:hypothetical protein